MGAFVFMVDDGAHRTTVSAPNMDIIKTKTGEEVIVDRDIYELLKDRKVSIRGRYPRIMVNGNSMYLHRFVNKTPDGLDTDHKNRNILDCRRDNLRTVTKSQNGCNRAKFPNRSSRFIGVSFRKKTNQWYAYVKLHGKMRSLGFFRTEIEAARARDAVAIKLHGEFAVLNAA